MINPGGQLHLGCYDYRLSLSSSRQSYVIKSKVVLGSGSHFCVTITTQKSADATLKDFNQVPSLSLSRWRTLILENWRSILILAWNMLNWKIQLNANTPSERISTLCTMTMQKSNEVKSKIFAYITWILTTHCSNNSNTFKTYYPTSFKFSHLCVLKYLQSLFSNLLKYRVSHIEMVETKWLWGVLEWRILMNCGA